MALSGEVINLILYVAQQLGMTLAVGAQTIVLLAYLLAMRDRVVDAKEAQFRRAVRSVLFAGLGLVVLSGLGITALHFLSGEFSVLFAPAFVFKWVLVIAVFILGIGIGLGWLPEWAGEGVVGGTWYALFLLHVLAPVTGWPTLLLLYAGWLVTFFLIWAALVFGTREPAVKPKLAPPPPAKTPEVSKVSESKPTPTIKSAASPPPPPPPIPLPKELPTIPSVPLAQAAVAAIPTPPAPAAKVAMPNLDEHPNLPAIRVMPKTPQEIATQNRPPAVAINP
jgi:hypothetical protein